MIRSTKNYTKNPQKQTVRTLWQMAKAKLYRQNHTKKHKHTHSGKEKKEKKNKEKRREQPNQKTNPPMITSTKNILKKQKAKNGQAEPYDKW